MKKTILSSQARYCCNHIEWMNSYIRMRIRYGKRLANQGLKEVMTKERRTMQILKWVLLV